MEIRHLRYFVAVAEEKSFTRATRRLHVSQPALSRQIREMEEKLGTPLLLRTPAGVELTSAGEQFLEGSRRLIQEFDELADVVREPRSPDVLRIGYMASSISGSIGKAIFAFDQKHPKMDVQVQELTPGRQLEALRANELDIALVGHAEPADDIQLRPLVELPMSIVVCASHPLADRTSVELREFAKDSFVGLDHGSFPGRNHLVEDACGRTGFSPAWYGDADGLNSLLTLVAQSKGVTLLPSETSTLPHPNSVFIALSPGELFVFHAATRTGDKRRAVREFLDGCTAP